MLISSRLLIRYCRFHHTSCTVDDIHKYWHINTILMYTVKQWRLVVVISGGAIINFKKSYTTKEYTAKPT